MKLALAQFSVEAPLDFAAFRGRLAALARDTREANADILILPEYAAMVLAGASIRAPDLAAELQNVVDQADALVNAFGEIAEAEQIYLLGGSVPMWDGHKIRNRAPFASPRGNIAFQDKQTMTRFESEQWQVSSGEGPKIFETALGLIGVSICYDSEFPLHVRAQAMAGAQILLVPSCTDNMAGFNRVRLSARARALENQFFTAVSPLVGSAPWSGAIDENHGYAALFGPPDRFFPADGVVARGRMNEPGLVIADADLSLVARTRRDGAVLNHRDWPGIAPCPILPLP